MKKIKIAQIGTEHDHAWGTAESLRKQDDIFEFIGYCNPEDIHARFDETSDRYRYSRRLTLEEILSTSDLDAVAIETSEHNLTKYSLIAAHHGLHIHMDKPGGYDHLEFIQLVEMMKSKNLIFHTGYMYRYNPAVIDALEMAKSGKLGQIYSVEAHMNCEQPALKRQWLAQYNGGMMYFLGCHLVDLIMQFQGEADEIIPLNKKTMSKNIDSEDLCMAIFKYKNGLSFAKSCGAEVGGFMRRQLVICGTKATVEINPLEYFEDTVGSSVLNTDMRIVDVSESEKVGWGAKGTTKTYGPFDRYDYMMQHFAKMINGEITIPDLYDYEIKLHKAVLNACGFNLK